MVLGSAILSKLIANYSLRGRAGILLLISVISQGFRVSDHALGSALTDIFEQISSAMTNLTRIAFIGLAG